MIDLPDHQQHDKSDLCRYIIVCNLINHVAEKILSSPTSKKVSLKVKTLFTFLAIFVLEAFSFIITH